MKFSDLRDRIDLQPTVDTVGFTYLATTPVIKQPGTLPYRIVLVAQFDQLIVWNQYFNTYKNDSNSGHLECSKPSFSNGDYFKISDLHRAMNRFGERVARDAQYIESIFRKVA